MSQKGKSRIYFIAIIPPPDIQERVTAIKQLFAEKYNSKGALRSPPHITLHMPFRWQENKEDQLTEFLEGFAIKNEQFNIVLNGFGAFPKRVIFIKIEQNERLQNLYQRLTQSIKEQLKLFNESYKNRGFHPHMTVAFKDLKSSAFLDAWPHFQNRDFYQEFSAESLCLLKHKGKTWDVHKNFLFEKA